MNEKKKIQREKRILKFIQFLKKEKIMGMFNYERNKLLSSKQLLEDNPWIERNDVKNILDTSQLINYSLLWSETKKGHYFWEQKNEKWRNYK